MYTQLLNQKNRNNFWKKVEKEKSRDFLEKSGRLENPQLF